MKELKHDRDNYLAEVRTLRDENKTLNQELIHLKTGQMERLEEIISRGEGSLSKRVSAVLSRLESENIQLHDKLHRLGVNDAMLKEKRRRLEELDERVEAHESKLREKEKLLHDRVNETAALDERIRGSLAEMGEMQDAVRHLEKVELAQRELRLSEISRNILNHESLNRSMVEKADSAERRIKAMLDEKQRILDSITRMDEVELPQHEARLKETISEAGQSRAELLRREGLLTGAERGVSVEKGRMEKLREKAMFLRMQHQKAEAGQKKLNEVLSRLGDDTVQKRARCDELGKTASQLELEICAQTDELGKIRESYDLLNDKIARQETLHKKLAGEADSLETKVQADTIKKQEIIKNVNHLSRVELPLHQARIRSVENGMAEHETLFRKLERERVAVEAHIQAKAAERQEIYDAIKRIEEVELPLRGSELKEMRAKVEQSQAELQNRQDSLVSMDREIYSESDELMELRKKNASLKAQYQEAQSEQKRLDAALVRLGTDISRKMSQHEDLARKRMRLESEIGTDKEALMDAEESAKSLEDKIHRHSGIMKEAERACVYARMMLAWCFLIGKRKTFFWILLPIFAAVLLAFAIRSAPF